MLRADLELLRQWESFVTLKQDKDVTSYCALYWIKWAVTERVLVVRYAWNVREVIDWVLVTKL